MNLKQCIQDVLREIFSLKKAKKASVTQIKETGCACLPKMTFSKNMLKKKPKPRKKSRLSKKAKRPRYVNGKWVYPNSKAA